MNANRTSEKQVRVFVSSTCRDLHTQPENLVAVAFPHLRELVEQLGLEFFDVDLCRGVPEKNADGETANSREYCRQWKDCVALFLVCIPGLHYGHRTEP